MTVVVAAQALPGPFVAARAARVVAATGLAIAAGAHFGAFPGHRGEGVVTAGFFLAVGVAQLATALVVARGWSPAIRRAVVAGNLSVLALWAWSRTAGIPFGSHPGVAEAVGVLDLAAAGAQAVAVVAVVMLPRTWTRHSILGPTVVVIAVTAVVAVGGAGLVPSSYANHPHDGDISASVTAKAPAAIGNDSAHPPPDVAPVETPSSANESGSAGEPDAGDHYDSGQDHAEPHRHP